MKKRGFVDIDWALSLAIFLIYLAWFFIYISPYFESRSDNHPLYSIIQENVDKSLYWTVSRIPIFIDSNYKNGAEPLIIDFNFNLTPNGFTLYPYFPFEISNSKLIILGDIRKGRNVIYIAYSNETYDNPITSFTGDLIHDENYTSSSNNSFYVEFKDSVPKRVFYQDQYLIQTINISVNEETLVKNSSEFNSGAIFSRNTYSNNYFTIDSYILSTNSNVQMFIDSIDSALDFNLTFSMELPISFTDYYLNSVYYGSIPRNSSGCLSFNWNYIDFYDSQKGVSFILSNNSGMNFCYSNTSIYFNISVPIANTRFHIYGHDGNYKSTINYSNMIDYKYGMKEKIKGVSLNEMMNLNSTNYFTIKSRWNYPTVNDFNILLLNSTDNSKIAIFKNSEPPLSDDVYVNDVYCHVLDKYGRKDKCKFLIQTW